ncbi:MAG: leucyl aminopeptidase [Proteobacteria bacterium]|nr:leucyl aminopeptidase [Pseudomonadota bacterium]
MDIAFARLALPPRGALIFPLAEGAGLPPLALRADRATGGQLKRAIAAARFKGRKGQSVSVLAPAGLRASRVLLVGLGKAAEIDSLAVENAGGEAIAPLLASGEREAAVAAEPVKGAKLGPAEIAALFAFGARLRSYRFAKYRTKEEEEKKPTLARLVAMAADPAAARRAFAPLAAVAEGVFETRNLVSEPPNVLYPASFAAEARRLSRLGVRVEVLDRRRIERLGMGALLGVAQGSAREPRVVVMRWRGAGAGRGARPVAFIGKGVTFDTGGISIKPSAGMEDMKWDMGGAGVVTGLMKALAGRRARVDAVGVIGLVENMPSGTAQRPSDIVRTMSGQTVEVLNTDAEGRLLLADVLYYARTRFKPRFMVDLATLTGAIVVALGAEHAGLFSNDDRLVERLIAAGKATGELLWRMPLAEAYDKMLESDAADMKNIGGRDAGPITAAQFLQRFVDKTPWAHLDIAGVTWAKKDKPTVPKGATAFGVRLLDRLVAEHYEGKG